MNKDLFKTIVAIATQGENAKIFQAKRETYEKLVSKTIEELDSITEQLFSEDKAIRKKAATALERKPLMDLMRDDAEIVREWFIDKSNRERISKAIEQEKDESILSTLISTIGFACERFSYSSLLSWTLSIDYLKFGYELLNQHLNSKSETVRFTVALALTQFRITEAWDILYDFTKKVNSKTYTKIANRLFNFGTNRLKVFDERNNGEKIQILETLNIAYFKEGLTQEQLRKFRTVLESAYKQKITSDTKSAIIKAFQSIGDKETITFLTEIAKEEQDKYDKEEIVRTIETLRERLT